MVRRSGNASSRKAVRSLVVFSDTHCGCQLGLFPPGHDVKMDNGGWYHPSDFQIKMWAFWREFWDQWVPLVTRGEPYDIVMNGDAIEGAHHRATTPITYNFNDQIKIAQAAIGPEVRRCLKKGGTYFHIRGTAAHVGESGVYEEMLAEKLGAKKNRHGQYARYDLWKRVGGPGGPLVHLLHHIGTTSSAAHESSAVNAELTAEYNESARWRREPPDYVVRSHRHRAIAVEIDGGNGYAAGIVTPAWQGKTDFVWKKAGARLSQPQFGGVMIRRGDEEHFFRRKTWSLERSDEE